MTATIAIPAITLTAPAWLLYGGIGFLIAFAIIVFLMWLGV